MDDQLAELECHLGAGADVATALAAVDQPPAPRKPARPAWQIGFPIAFAIYVTFKLLWR